MNTSNPHLSSVWHPYLNSSASSALQFQYVTWPYVLSSPFVWVFSQWVRAKKRAANGTPIDSYAWFYDRYSAPVKAVRTGATRWPALKAVYEWKPGRPGVLGLCEAFWMNVRSAQALRNRYLIVVEQIRKAAEEAIARDGEARIMSLACGSAQSVFVAVQGLAQVKITAIDVDPTALAYSRLLAETYGITDIEWREGNVLRPGAIAANFQPNVVEIVGLFDYLSDKLITGLITRVKKMSAKQFSLISAHIHPNPETEILRDLADWEMTYRSYHHFTRLIEGCQFSQNQFITEPHAIFTVARSDQR